MEIKKYQNLTIITLKSGKKLYTETPKVEVYKILNDTTKNYLMIDGVVFNRMTEVSEVDDYNPNDLESFIISQSDKKIREELESIKKERDAK
jgi:hypothetical protein